MNCSSIDLEQHTCNHLEDAGVDCEGDKLTWYLAQYSQIGLAVCKGRVYFCVNRPLFNPSLLS